MAPKRRSLKKGERRMDAALDAMIPYGFPNKLVRRTVDQLLKVYGGNDGWVFIEDSAYTLLINTLLEQQQQEDQDQDGLIEDNPGNAAGCSKRTLLLPCTNTETSDDAPLANQALDTISAASETGNQLPVAVDSATATSKAVIELPIKPVDTSAATSQPVNQLSIMAVDTATSKTVNKLPLKAVDTVSAIMEIDDQVPIKVIIDSVSAENEYEPPQTKSPQPIGKLCHKRRRPCHGWLSSDDEEEEEEDLIELSALHKLVNGVN
ncbi:uncharacterized protein LOC123902730 [Trifolium pratense]|uniref:uncharacterized protein LOC123902730 n=1 Tax=Trifolium pratense TaxID=57577 RepID=UPI001E697E09|nr:uncharacterized protein LOC123902730 [Trifolium pratense]